MSKALLLDADGVVLKKQSYFSEVYSKEYNVSLEKIIPFFRNEFLDCQLGKIDIKEVLPKYLKEWGWQKSVDDFLQYWFESSTIVDKEVENKVQEIRALGTKCYLVTDQEKYRAEYLRKNLYFEKKFDGCFFSCEIGYSKSSPEFFKVVFKQLELNPSDIIFLDDEEKNIVVAEQLGIKATLYTGFLNFSFWPKHND